MYLLCFYVPATHAEEVKNAVFAAGAGRLGDYAHCSWQTRGEGQFLPLDASKPFLGRPDKLEVVEEYKVELVCPTGEIARKAVAALLAAHPYEEPAYHLIAIQGAP